MESFHRARLEELGLVGEFAQENVSFSRRGVLRGVHFQTPIPQARLVFAPQGEIFDAAVDVRRGSPWFGKWVGVVLSAENRRQLWIPAGFGHGFLVTSETALVVYKCASYYDPGGQRSVRWSDPDIGIGWPAAPTLVSEKDRKAPLLGEIDPRLLPVFEEEGG
jgi:dTDP-4-dehydrorhamnose 3,5-epimerase